jgi:hypothetical protein
MVGTIGQISSNSDSIKSLSQDQVKVGIKHQGACAAPGGHLVGGESDSGLKALADGEGLAENEAERLAYQTGRQTWKAEHEMIKPTWWGRTWHSA